MDGLSAVLRKREKILKINISFLRQGFDRRKWKYVLVPIAGVAFCLMMGLAFYGKVAAGVVFLAYLPFFCKRNFRLLKEKEKLKIQDEFIDAITAMSFSLQAGYSVENALEFAAEEAGKLHGNSPMTKQLRKSVGKIKRNEPTSQVFTEMAESLDIEEIRDFAEIFNCAKKSGGNLVGVIRKTSEQMKEKQEINTEINTLISGKKLEQKILCAMPVLIIMYLKVGAESFIAPMYGNPLGVICMSFCAAVYIGAITWSEKITDISI